MSQFFSLIAAVRDELKEDLCLSLLKDEGWNNLWEQPAEARRMEAQLPEFGTSLNRNIRRTQYSNEPIQDVRFSLAYNARGPVVVRHGASLPISLADRNAKPSFSVKDTCNVSTFEVG